MGSNGRRPSFWTSMPGILTGIAAVIGSITGLLAAISHFSSQNSQPSPSPPPTILNPIQSPPSSSHNPLPQPQSAPPQNASSTSNDILKGLDTPVITVGATSRSNIEQAPSLTITNQNTNNTSNDILKGLDTPVITVGATSRSNIEQALQR